MLFMQYICSMKRRVVRKAPVNRRVFYLCIQVAVNAVLIGLVAKVLVGLIDFITNLSFYGRLSFEPASPAGNHLGLLVLAVPVVGAVLVGLMARYGSKAIGGHGIPEAMEKIILEDSRIPPALTFLKPLSAAISIGTGGPFGAEGPIIATGGAFGSLTGQWMHISSAERKIVLAAGACAGMSAIFGSPLAAVLLAIELLLFEFSPRSIIPVVIGCVTGAGMHILLFGSSPVFSMPEILAPSDSALAAYVVLGLIVGVAAAGVSRSIYIIEDLFEKLPVHWMWWPAIGAIAIGVTGYFAPHTMGVGYDNITYLLGGSWSWRILFSLCVLKYVSWAVSLGSGTSGGTLAPLFTMGGGLGAMLGLGAMYFFPSLGIDPATAALAGMAAMFAGASRALLTSVVFALETTGQAHGVLPVLGASVAAYFLSFFLMRGSIMTEKIKRRGVSAPDAYEPDVLQGVLVKQLVTAAPVIEGAYVYGSDDVGLAAEIMGRYGVDQLQVRESKDSGKVTGVITAASILAYYSQQKQKEHVYDSPGRTRRIMVQGRKLLFFKMFLP
jgi:H+/Cl- antiporter ClcA